MGDTKVLDADLLPEGIAIDPLDHPSRSPLAADAEDPILEPVKDDQVQDARLGGGEDGTHPLPRPEILYAVGRQAMQ